MKPLGLVLPHAKVRYSGHIAHAGLSTTLGQSYDRVVILGTNHESKENGFYSGFSEFPRFIEPPGDGALIKEHSVEWLAPLINKYLRAPTVSFVIGENNEQAHSVVSRYLRPNTLVIASSDLSHYSPAEVARRKDAVTIGAVLSGSQKNMEACGAESIKLLMDLVSAPRTLIAYGNSGQITDDWNSVVGYAAIRFGELPSRLMGAVEALRALLRGKRPLPTGPKQAVFITITQAGKLQGCTGQIRPEYPLAEAVRQALASTLDDPRRTSKQISGSEIKLSLISPLKPTELEDVRIGPDGVVVEASDDRAALFLPEVPVENHWRHERYLRELLQKAEVKPSERYRLYRFTTDCATILT